MRALKARNLADKTLRTYGDSLTALVDHAGATQLGDLDRDAIRAFLDTGMRLSELAGLTVDDLNMEADAAFVVGKGRRPRGCPFWRQGRPGVRPVSARPRQAPTVVRAGAVARRETKGQ
jgi:site-specific recombinase XerC